MSQRTDRVDELLREEIGTLLAKEVADPRIGFATITDVETAPDLRHAKVWVSVIGQKGDRDETLRALAQAMPFIRHELGRRLRIKRIPELHVRLDDSAERGTRVLHLLTELEAGVEPGRDRADQRIAARPRSSGCPTRATPTTPTPMRGRRPQASPARRRPRPPTGSAGSRARRAPARPRRPKLAASPAAIRRQAPQAGMTAAPPIDLSPWPGTRCRTPVLERLRGARHVLAVSHENPDADTLGAVLGVCLLVEALGGRATAVCTDVAPPIYGFLPGIDRFRTDPEPGADYDLLVLADCATAERVGDVARRHADLFASLPRLTIDHHASNDGAGEADWIDPEAAATCEMVALLAVASTAR